MNWIIENWTGILAAIGGLYAAAVAITALTPTPKDDEVVGKVWSVWSKLVSALGIDPKTGLKK